MELTSLTFFAFVLLCCIIYYVVPHKAQWVILLIASMTFFILSCGFLTVYMLLTTAVIYFGAQLISKKSDEFQRAKGDMDKAQRKEAKKQLKKAQKHILVWIVIITAGILVVLKYGNLGVEFANFFMRIFNTGVSLKTFSLAMPLGISYYTLMAISYVTDVYRGVIKAEKNPLKVLLFVSYFPHITEGPFDRYKDLSPQFEAEHRFDWDAFCKGLVLVLYGLLKKMVIADWLGMSVSEVFDNSAIYSGPAVVIATVMYTIQLYCDFSGCIDIIAGVSELFGIKVAENFRQPFFSKSISEFWRRWHITLGMWLKEYVYYPVILSGHFKAVDKFAKKHLKSRNLIAVVPAAYALFFVWFTNGLWHGASFKFILYGLYYYVLMMIGELCKPLSQKIKDKLRIKDDNVVYGLFQMARTFVIVNFGMLLFRCATVGEFVSTVAYSFSSFDYIRGLKQAVTTRMLIVAFLAIIVVFIVSVIRERNPGRSVRDMLFEKPFIIRYLLILGLVIWITAYGIYGPGYNAADFVYAQF